MLIRLKSAFLGPRLQLLLKSALFGATLIILKLGDFSVVSFLLFAAVSGFLCLKIKALPVITLVPIAASTVWILDSWLFLMPAIILYTLLLYIIIGIEELIIVHRREWGTVAALLQLYSIFLLFFLVDKSENFLLKYAFTVVGSFLVIHEIIRHAENQFPKRQMLAALVLSFITGQFLWGIALLPIGMINAASLMTLITFLGADMTSAHFQGLAKQRIIVR